MRGFTFLPALLLASVILTCLAPSLLRLRPAEVTSTCSQVALGGLSEVPSSTTLSQSIGFCEVIRTSNTHLSLVDTTDSTEIVTNPSPEVGYTITLLVTLSLAAERTFPCAGGVADTPFSPSTPPSGISFDALSNTMRMVSSLCLCLFLFLAYHLLLFALFKWIMHWSAQASSCTGQLVHQGVRNHNQCHRQLRSSCGNYLSNYARQAHGAFFGQWSSNFSFILFCFTNVFRMIRYQGDRLRVVERQNAELVQGLRDLQATVRNLGQRFEEGNATPPPAEAIEEGESTPEGPAEAVQGIPRETVREIIDRMKGRARYHQGCFERSHRREVENVRLHGETALAQANRRNEQLEFRVFVLESAPTLPAFQTLQRAISEWHFSSLDPEGQAPLDPIVVPLLPPIVDANDGTDDDGDNGEDDDDTDDERLWQERTAPRITDASIQASLQRALNDSDSLAGRNDFQPSSSRLAESSAPAVWPSEAFDPRAGAPSNEAFTRQPSDPVTITPLATSSEDEAPTPSSFVLEGSDRGQGSPAPTEPAGTHVEAHPDGWGQGDDSAWLGLEDDDDQSSVGRDSADGTVGQQSTAPVIASGLPAAAVATPPSDTTVPSVASPAQSGTPSSEKVVTTPVTTPVSDEQAPTLAQSVSPQPTPQEENLGMSDCGAEPVETDPQEPDKDADGNVQMDNGRIEDVVSGGQEPQEDAEMEGHDQEPQADVEMQGTDATASFGGTQQGPNEDVDMEQPSTLANEHATEAAGNDMDTSPDAATAPVPTSSVPATQQQPLAEEMEGVQSSPAVQHTPSVPAQASDAMQGLERTPATPSPARQPAPAPSASSFCGSGGFMDRLGLAGNLQSTRTPVPTRKPAAMAQATPATSSTTPTSEPPRRLHPTPQAPSPSPFPSGRPPSQDPHLPSRQHVPASPARGQSIWPTQARPIHPQVPTLPNGFFQGPPRGSAPRWADGREKTWMELSPDERRQCSPMVRQRLKSILKDGSPESAAPPPRPPPSPPAPPAPQHRLAPSNAGSSSTSNAPARPAPSPPQPSAASQAEREAAIVAPYDRLDDGENRARFEESQKDPETKKETEKRMKSKRRNDDDDDDDEVAGDMEKRDRKKCARE